MGALRREGRASQVFCRDFQKAVALPAGKGTGTLGERGSPGLTTEDQAATSLRLWINKPFFRYRVVSAYTPNTAASGPSCSEPLILPVLLCAWLADPGPVLDPGQQWPRDLGTSGAPSVPGLGVWRWGPSTWPVDIPHGPCQQECRALPAPQSSRLSQGRSLVASSLDSCQPHILHSERFPIALDEAVASPGTFCSAVGTVPRWRPGAAQAGLALRGVPALPLASLPRRCVGLSGPLDSPRGRQVPVAVTSPHTRAGTRHVLQEATLKSFPGA